VPSLNLKLSDTVCIFSVFGLHLSKLIVRGYFLRRFRRCVASERAANGTSICHEAGTSMAFSLVDKPDDSPSVESYERQICYGKARKDMSVQNEIF
jgi:hypothetical protein